MNIYNTFYYASEHPVASGNLVAFRQVKRVYPFEAAYRRTIISKLQTIFSGKTQELKMACEALGGTPLPQGDVGYMLPVFPFLNIAVLFWDGMRSSMPRQTCCLIRKSQSLCMKKM